MKSKRDIKEAWKAWQNCLYSDDPNSIMLQIIHMNWNTAIYRLIHESRRATIRQNPQKPQVNLYFHTFLDNCFYESQAAALRRIIDSPHSSINENRKDVYSLRALLKDIQDHRKQLDRKTYIQLQRHDNTDWDDIHDGQYQKIFDQLSMTSENTRRGDDLISNQVLEKINRKIDQTSCEVMKYVDKFIAHSATPESRRIDNLQEDITLGDIWNAQKIVIEVSVFLLNVLFNKEWVLLPFVPPAFYENWGATLYNEDDTEMLEQVMRNYQNEMDQLRINSQRDVWSWIEDSK